jgi:hypothetical protein
MDQVAQGLRYMATVITSRLHADVFGGSMLDDSPKEQRTKLPCSQRLTRRRELQDGPPPLVVVFAVHGLCPVEIQLFPARIFRRFNA